MHSITLMEAYAIESLRSNGYSNETIIEKAENKETGEFKSISKGIDYSALDGLAESGDLKDIMEKGYQVKFLTLNGLRNLIRMKYGQEDGLDYLFDNFTVTGLQLDEEEQKELEAMLSQNWEFSVEGNGVSITPAK